MTVGSAHAGNRLQHYRHTAGASMNSYKGFEPTSPATEWSIRVVEAKHRLLLENLGLGLGQMPEHISQNVAVISSAAEALGLDSASPEALCSGVVHLRQRTWDAQLAQVKSTAWPQHYE